MGFRTVVIESHCKLECQMNYLIYRTINETKRILIDEISVLIVDSMQCAMTSSVFYELAKKKIKIILCDSKHNPYVDVESLYGDAISSKRILEQINWDIDIKQKIWKEIIKKKIENQANNVKNIDNKAYSLIHSYIKDVKIGDTTNREGHAAKVYFNTLFGKDFTRDIGCKINMFLDYGYAIILSCFNRAIVSKGYLTQLGIHHKNEFNKFNLSSDLMEPFRTLVDEEIINSDDSFQKSDLIKILYKEVIIKDKKQSVYNAINIYCDSIFEAINSKDISKICFYEKEK